jgi:hypothetical protein
MRNRCHLTIAKSNKKTKWASMEILGEFQRALASTISINTPSYGNF